MPVALSGCLLAVLVVALALVPAAQAAGPATTIVLALSAPTVQADGTSSVTATATVTDAAMLPVPGDTVTFSSTDPGEQICCAAPTDVNGTSTATITSSTTAGPVTITATDTTAGIPPVTQPLTQTPGPATQISLGLVPSSISANGRSSSIATATVTDAHGNPVPNDNVGFASSNPGESISGVANHMNGDYSASITSSHTAGSWTITATDSTTGISTNQTLRETAPIPTKIVLGVQPLSITANGTSAAIATATVTDAFGNPISGLTTIGFSTNRGQSISGTTDNGNGTYTATITSTRIAGTATITAQDTATGVTSNQQTLTQTPGPPAAVVLGLSPTTITANGVSSSTATATVTDAFGNPVPGLTTVSFSSTDPSDKISGTTDTGNGTYTATITSTHAGQATITAMVGGLTSNSQTLTKSPGRATKIALTLQPPVIAADGISKSNATVTVTDAFGNAVTGDTVRFTSSNPGERIFPTGNPYSAWIFASTHPGSWTITATDMTVGISNQQTLKEVAGTSATNLVISPASSVSTNQTVTLFATVNGSGGSPSGTVQFLAGFFTIAGCASVPVSPANTLAICQTSFAASQAPLQITAVFTPDLASSVAGSSTVGILNVGRGSTATTVGASSPSVSVGAPETYTALVSPGNQGAVAPSGSVRFADGGKTIRGCANMPLRASGGAATASCSASYAASGTRRVTAIYSGDQNFIGSSSKTLQVPVLSLRQVAAFVQWFFRHIGQYTTVASLQVVGLSLGTKVIITCQGGHGCPFARRTVALSGGIRCTPTGKHQCGPHRKGPIDLAGPFRRHRLKTGTRITIKIVRPGWDGKIYSIVIRLGGAVQVRIGCLAPGQSKPGVGC